MGHPWHLIHIPPTETSFFSRWISLNFSDTFLRLAFHIRVTKVYELDFTIARIALLSADYRKKSDNRKEDPRYEYICEWYLKRNYTSLIRNDFIHNVKLFNCSKWTAFRMEGFIMKWPCLVQCYHSSVEKCFHDSNGIPS